MPGQRAQSHSMTATKLASPHPALSVQSSQTRYLLAATSTNSNSRLFCHKKSPSQITRRLHVGWSDVHDKPPMHSSTTRGGESPEALVSATEPLLIFDCQFIDDPCEGLSPPWAVGRLV